MRKFVLLAFVLLLFTTIVSPSAEGSLLTLSTHSSNGFDPYTRAEYLDATLDFTVVDNELRLVVTNTTNGNPEGCEFDIVAVFLNYGGGVTGLTYATKQGTVGWTLEDNPDNIHVDLFGYYDVALRDEATPDKPIKPSFSETFDFIIGGTPPFSEDNFTLYLSAENSTDILGLAAAKFDNGGLGGNAWANGMVVPEPATLALLGLGSLLLLRRKRRV